MKYTENIGEGLKIQLAVASLVERYGVWLQEKEMLPKKMKELLKVLLFENLKEGVTDEGMAELLERECEAKNLDPEEVMAHFSTITERFPELIDKESV